MKELTFYHPGDPRYKKVICVDSAQTPTAAQVVAIIKARKNAPPTEAEVERVAKALWGPDDDSMDRLVAATLQDLSPALPPEELQRERRANSRLHRNVRDLVNLVERAVQIHASHPDREAVEKYYKMAQSICSKLDDAEDDADEPLPLIVERTE